MTSCSLWNIDLFLQLVKDASQVDLDPETYLEQQFRARLSQFPDKYIYFCDSRYMTLFQLKYSEYLNVD